MIRACIPALAWLAGLFATLGVLLWMAGDACLERGGKASDSAWVCEFANRQTESLWSYVSWPQVAAAALLVGLPLVVLVRRLGRRWDSCAAPRHG